MTALIGPSGCGKSTFLRILNRMHELIPGAAVSGAVELDGKDIYSPMVRVTETRLRIGMVFQRPNPFPSMTIAQNILAGPRLSGVRVEDRETLVRQCLERAGLWNETRNRLNDPATSLSGGQQQRLCIARSLAVSPRVLLLDEPCSALDPISTRVIEETIAELRNDMTIIIVTHNMQQAQRVSQDSRSSSLTARTSRVTSSSSVRPSSSSRTPSIPVRRTTCTVASADAARCQPTGTVGARPQLCCPRHPHAPAWPEGEARAEPPLTRRGTTP